MEGHVKDAHQCSCLRHWLICQTQKGSDNSMAVPERGAEEMGDFGSSVHSTGRWDLEELVPLDRCPKSPWELGLPQHSGDKRIAVYEQRATY